MHRITLSPPRTSIAVIAGLLIAVSSVCGCKKKTPTTVAAPMTKDLVHAHVLEEVRLGDGMPVNISLSIRWRIEDFGTFTDQFNTAESFDSLVLAPREMEIAAKVANEYTDVDSVFTTQRHAFINALKESLLSNLGESGITIKEVIVSDVIFPMTYTNAMEQLAMQEQELERIRKQSVIDLEKSVAAQQQAQEDGKLAMAQAEMDAKVQRINAETEKSIRENRLAQAETEKQVQKLQAQAQAEKMELLAQAELKKQKEVQALQMDEQREKDKLAVLKQKEMDALVFNKDMQMAKLCIENPAYANYMVNKELASKVQIAVLPSNQDASVFSGLLNSGLSQR